MAGRSTVPLDGFAPVQFASPDAEQDAAAGVVDHVSFGETDSTPVTVSAVNVSVCAWMELPNNRAHTPASNQKMCRLAKKCCMLDPKRRLCLDRAFGGTLGGVGGIRHRLIRCCRGFDYRRSCRLG